MGPEVKIPLDKCAKTNDEYLVTKRRNGGHSCDDDDTGSIEARYFGNQDSAWSKGAKHGFGNAKRHVLLSLCLILFLLFIFLRLARKFIGLMGSEVDI